MNIVCPNIDFPCNSYAVRPNSFDIPFSQRSLVSPVLTALSICIVVSPLCLGPQLSWIVTMLTVDPQFVLACCALIFEFLGPFQVFPPVSQEAFFHPWRSVSFF